MTAEQRIYRWMVAKERKSPRLFTFDEIKAGVQPRPFLFGPLRFTLRPPIPAMEVAMALMLLRREDKIGQVIVSQLGGDPVTMYQTTGVPVGGYHLGTSYRVE